MVWLSDVVRLGEGEVMLCFLQEQFAGQTLLLQSEGQSGA